MSGRTFSVQLMYVQLMSDRIVGSDIKTVGSENVFV